MTNAIHIQCRTLDDAEQVLAALKGPAALAAVRSEQARRCDGTSWGGTPPPLLIPWATSEDLSSLLAALAHLDPSQIEDWHAVENCPTFIAACEAA